MIGAIIGDIVGSRYEFNNIKTKAFDLFHSECRVTDDSIMTIAIAQALLESQDSFSDLSEKAVDWMQKLGRLYPHAGYGGRFRHWLTLAEPKPYHSLGNGAAMRVSACGLVGKTIEEVKMLSRKVTEVTHNHPEGLKAAEATAIAIYMAKIGKTKDEIFQYVNDHYYVIDFTLDEIRDTYTFDVTCGGTMPVAFAAFFESVDFEDAIKNAVSIGGDSDTIAAITGSIAGEYYEIPYIIRRETAKFLDHRLLKMVRDIARKLYQKEIFEDD